MLDNGRAGDGVQQRPASGVASLCVCAAPVDREGQQVALAALVDRREGDIITSYHSVAARLPGAAGLRLRR